MGLQNLAPSGTEGDTIDICVVLTVAGMLEVDVSVTLVLVISGGVGSAGKQHVISLLILYLVVCDLIHCLCFD